VHAPGKAERARSPILAGGGIAGKDAPRAATGDDLERFLKENYPYGFSLIHKFSKDVCRRFQRSI
jgi:hypothetical protein